MTATVSQTLPLDVALRQAVAHHQAGRLQEAEQLYRAILQAQPYQPDANHNLGVLAGQVGRHVAALPYLKTALAMNPAHAQYALSYANALLASDQAGEALAVLEAAGRRGLDTPAVQALRRKAEVAVHPPRAPEAAPSHAEMNRLVTLFNTGRYEELENHARLLIERHPDCGFAWQGLGISLRLQGKGAASLPALQRTTELLPDDAEGHNNLGNALRDLGHLDPAVASYRRALEIKPDFADVHFNLGNALQERKRFDEAVACYSKALALKPENAEAHGNLGNALRELGRLIDSAASYQSALEIEPANANIRSNLSLVQLHLGKPNDAVANCQKVLEIKPDDVEARSNLLFTYNHLPDPSSSEMLAEARRYGRQVAQPDRAYANWRNSPEADRCLRVGLVSGDLRTHPVGHFVEGVLAALADTASGRLEFHAYPNQTHSDEITERIKACCQGWCSATRLSDENLAQRIYDDGIDILIDLSGHTGGNRLPVFAWKPAPIQVGWLGYFATTGVGAMDYIIADPWTVPEVEESHFIEKIRRLPETYLCFTPPDADVPVTLPPVQANGAITFGCFNNLSKINDAVVALWARVLSAVPGSRLFLKTARLGEAAVRQSVVDRFAACDIESGRLIMEGAAPRTELLAAYRRVDIALDPFPYPGGATSVEALWMGVPVLTMAGDRFLSHIGESILQNAGLPEWIANDADDYVARAVLHAGDLPRLVTLRNRLRQQVLASPIFDAPRFARHFEAALREMWRDWCDSRA